MRIINTIGENLLLDLHKMQANIGNKCHSFWCQNNSLRAFQNIFYHNLKPFGIHPPFQIEVTNDWNLINRYNNIVVGIICIIFGDMNSSWMEIEHCAQTFLYNIQDSKLINKNNELNFILGMKSCHFNRNQTKQRFEE